MSLICLCVSLSFIVIIGFFNSCIALFCVHWIVKINSFMYVCSLSVHVYARMHAVKCILCDLALVVCRKTLWKPRRLVRLSPSAYLQIWCSFLRKCERFRNMGLFNFDRLTYCVLQTDRSPCLASGCSILLDSCLFGNDVISDSSARLIIHNIA